MNNIEVLFRGNTTEDYKSFITSAVKPGRATNTIKAINLAVRAVHLGESLCYVARGFEAKTRHAAVLLLTDQRIIIGHHNQMLSGGEIVLDYPTINKVTTKKSWGSKSVTFHHSDEETTVSTLTVGDPGEIRDITAAIKKAQIRQPSHESSISGDNSIERISELAKLHESGALTDEEFATVKKRILGL